MADHSNKRIKKCCPSCKSSNIMKRKHLVVSEKYLCIKCRAVFSTPLMLEKFTRQLVPKFLKKKVKVQSLTN